VNEAQRLWDECAGILQAQVSEPVWLTSFEAARPTRLEGNVLTLSVPSFLAKERIEGRYLSLVRGALTEVGAANVELALEIAPNEPEPQWTVAPPTTVSTPAPGEVHDINSRYSFETFVIGPSNRFAHAAALAVAETPARKYNPLFVYGDAGLGKTHLLQAIAHYVRENYPTYRVRYVTSEAFLNEFIDAVRTGSNDAFKRRYRDIDVLLVDDIQFIEGKKETQEEFFHTFNHLHQANRQIVLSSDRPPDAIGTLEDRLRSRFKQGLITDVQPPDLETRLAILRNKAEREATWIPPEVLEFIATNITDNIRVLEGALIRVAAFASLTAEQLTVETAGQVLGDLLTARQPRPITPQVILDTTSKMFGIPVEEIVGKKRQRPLVAARQVAMYVMRDLTDLSYPAIAREFGGRDHTTVIHAVEKITNQMKSHRPTYDQVTELCQTIRAEA
jgi:chromosomal replication initiator protein